MNSSPYKKIVLDNGLRVVLIPQPASYAATVLVLVEAGSKYETKEIGGLSHFLEHMCFKGTKRRPKPMDIDSELTEMGAVSNAFTSSEYTGYFTKVEFQKLTKALEVVSDIYLNSVFDAQEIEKERGVIIEEINMILDAPMQYIGYTWLELLYGDQPAGWSIAGEKETIKKLKRDDFLNYRSQHYLPQSTVVVVSGKFEEAQILKMIGENFADIKTGEKMTKMETKEVQEEPQALIKSKNTDQTHLILGVRAFNIFDSRKYALQLLSGILGESRSSRLYQKIRGEMGAAYYIYSDVDLYSDHGYLAVGAGIDHQKIEQVIEAMLSEFRKLKAEPVPQDELERSKEYLIGTLMLSLETSDAIANFYGGQELITRQIVSPEEIAQKIRSITSEDIMKLASEIISDKRLNMAIIGPFEDKERFEKILNVS